MADKKEIIQALEEMSVLLELKGENVFKVRAFSNAARILQGLSEDFDKLIENNRITEVKGIGQGIADVIMEIVEKGKSSELESMKKEIPAGLLEMMKIPGMGPKKIRAVWTKLDITNIGELEYACKENRLIDLEGFGLKTQEKILKGIDLVKKYSERHLISDVLPVAEEIFTKLKKEKGVIRSALAGSLRRRRETIKDIDYLVSARESDRESIMDDFTKLPQVDSITGQGLTKTSVVLKNGISADLRIVDDSQFPYALHHSTGSKEHNVAMRELARKSSLKMNEYGLFRNETENIDCKNEEQIYKQLGMTYIPPELRENFGEIEAALKNYIPKLIEESNIKGVIHVHSNYSDGINSIAEMAHACQERGYEYLVISDHSQSANYANGLKPDRVKQQHQEIDQLNKKLKNFRILKSIESDILADGSLDYGDDILKSFDLVIASIHSRFNMTEDEATKRVIKALENPFTTILGHPTGRVLLAREGYPVNMKKVIDAAAYLDVSIELNANPHRLDIDWRIIHDAKNKGVRISIDPDAHRIDGIEDIRYGVGIARKGWLTKADVLNCLTAEELLKFARRG
ncbi:MAG: DNA polymerase/3'-5' exonuclease PolX [Calditrichota bacterium]